MRWPHIIFAPNPSGAITVANAVVFWACVEAAAEKGYVLLVRIDDQWGGGTYPGQDRPNATADTMQHFLNSFQELRAYLCSHEYTNRYGLPMIFRGHGYSHYWHVLDSAIVRGMAERVGDGCYRMVEGDPSMVTIMQDYEFGAPFMSACDIYQYNTPFVLRGGNMRKAEKHERLMLDALQAVFGYGVDPQYRYTPQFYMFPYPQHYGLLGVDGRPRCDFNVGGDPVMRKSALLPAATFREWAQRFKNPETRTEEIRAALEEVAKMGDAVIYHEDGSIEPWKEAPK